MNVGVNQAWQDGAIRLVENVHAPRQGIPRHDGRNRATFDQHRVIEKRLLAIENAGAGDGERPVRLALNGHCRRRGR
jgi:hypothetical protein